MRVLRAPENREYGGLAMDDISAVVIGVGGKGSGGGGGGGGGGSGGRGSRKGGFFSLCMGPADVV